MRETPTTWWHDSADLDELRCGLTHRATGVTTKADTKNDGTNANPAFRETAKKTVNIQTLFSGTTYAEGRAYYETYFDLENQSFAEAEEGLVLNCAGLVYGVIEEIHGFGNRY